MIYKNIWVGTVLDYAEYAKEILGQLLPLAEELELTFKPIYCEMHKNSDPYFYDRIVTKFSLPQEWAKSGNAFDFQITEYMARCLYREPNVIGKDMQDEHLTKTLKKYKEDVTWLNTLADNGVHVKDFWDALAKFGILIDKTGSMVAQANRFPHIRAVSPMSVDQAKHFRSSLNANVLVFSGMYQPDTTKCAEIVKAFVTTDFQPNEQRITQIRAIYDSKYGRM